MRTPEEKQALRDRAVGLRLAGKSLREIKQILGPMSNTTLQEALKGVPPPDTYHGCLRIDVLHSSGLYRKIGGWAAAVMTA